MDDNKSHKPIFSRNIDVDKIAFLNWRTWPHEDILNIEVLADGYLSSAIELTNLCLLDNSDKNGDKLIFPIFANANHGIELYLKAIRWTLNKIAKSDMKTGKGHNIKQIFEEIRGKVKTYQGNFKLKDFDQLANELQDYIHELFSKLRTTSNKDKMDFARYTFSTKYENHFYIDETENVEVDLENLVIRLRSIKKNFETILELLYHGEYHNDM